MVNLISTVQPLLSPGCTVTCSYSTVTHGEDTIYRAAIKEMLVHAEKKLDPMTLLSGLHDCQVKQGFALLQF